MLQLRHTESVLNAPVHIVAQDRDLPLGIFREVPVKGKDLRPLLEYPAEFPVFLKGKITTHGKNTENLRIPPIRSSFLLHIKEHGKEDALDPKPKSNQRKKRGYEQLAVFHKFMEQ